MALCNLSIFGNQVISLVKLLNKLEKRICLLPSLFRTMHLLTTEEKNVMFFTLNKLT